MEQALDTILAGLKETGCTDDTLKKAKQVYETGTADELIRFFRRYRCGLMEELHESQRRVDCLDYLIRQTKNKKTGL